MFGTAGMPDWVEVTGHGSQRRLLLTATSEEGESYNLSSIIGTTQQTVVADALTQTGELWVKVVTNISTRGHGSIFQLQDAVLAINNGYYQPYTVASCIPDVIRGPQDDSAISFPLPQGFKANPMMNPVESLLNISSIVYSGITKHQIFGSNGSLQESRLQWVELPQDTFNGSAIGAVVSLPRSIANSTQELLVCTLGAGWGSSTINTSSFAGGTTFTTSSLDFSGIEKLLTRPTGPNEYSDPQAESLADTNVASFAMPSFPEKPIIVTEVWANYLNPFVPALNTTVINALMSTNSPAGELTSRQQIATAEWALCGLLTNGLASIGATSTLQGSLKTTVKPDGSREFDGNYWFSGKGDAFIVDPEESKDWVKLRVDTTTNGYAYNIHGASPKVAITFLLIYCVIALSHVLYAGITGKSVFHNIVTYSDLLTTQAFPPRAGTPSAK